MCELIEGSCVVVSSIRASPVPFTESASFGEERLTSLEENTNMGPLFRLIRFSEPNVIGGIRGYLIIELS